MQFNPDPNKEANKVIFSRKSKVCHYPPLTFNNNDVRKCPHQKHLGIILDSKLDFNIHVDNKIKKVLIKKAFRLCSEKSFPYHLKVLHQAKSGL